MEQEGWKIAFHVVEALSTGLLLYVVRWLWKLGKRTDNSELQIKVLGRAVQSLLELIEQNGKLSKESARAIANSIKIHVEAEGNPITHEEAEKLNGYIQRSREGGAFTPSEAQEFRQLVDKYRMDPKVLEKTPAEELGALLVLAGVIFTIYALANSGKGNK